MYCAYDGTSHADDAQFCVKCGRPLRGEAGPTHQPRPMRVETCMIRARDGSKWNTGKMFEFYAEAMSPKGGRFVAGVSKNFGCDRWGNLTADNKDGQRALNDLIQKLMADGWKPTGSVGQSWYNHSFEREEVPPKGFAEFDASLGTFYRKNNRFPSPDEAKRLMDEQKKLLRLSQDEFIRLVTYTAEQLQG